MVAGPASEEVVNTGGSSPGGSPTAKAGSAGPLPRRSAAGTPGAGRPARPRQSRLGRMSEAKLAGQQGGQPGQAQPRGSSYGGWVVAGGACMGVQEGPCRIGWSVMSTCMLPGTQCNPSLLYPGHG